MIKYSSIEEIAKLELSSLSKEDITYIKETSPTKEDMIQFHSSAGRHIRNTYKLWDKNNPLTKSWYEDREAGVGNYIEDNTDNHPCHPESISMKVLYRVWELAHDI